jgi:signal transduction histidine kinase
MVEQGTRAAEIIHSLNKIWGRVLSWTDDFLNLVRIDASPVLSPSDVDLPDLLNTFERNIFLTQFASRNLQLRMDICKDLPKVRADQELLLRVFQQLATRAAVRSVPGDQIQIQVHGKEKEVWIDVRDQGPEVSETDLVHLFDKSISRLQTRSLHTGIELATVKALVTKMGGEVWIGGQGPMGSTITICLPTA